MAKTFKGLVEIIESKHEVYSNLPEAHLSSAGLEVRFLYSKLAEELCFTDTPEGLRKLIAEDSDYSFKSEAAVETFGKVQRYLDAVIAQGGTSDES